MELLRKGKLVIGLESIESQRNFIIRGEKERKGGMKEELGAGDEGVFLIYHIPGNAHIYYLRREVLLGSYEDAENSY